MSFTTIGKSEVRKDAYAKVCGKADYTNDIFIKNMAYAKIFRANITHGVVKSLDISDALKVNGVIKVITYDDVPEYKFPTAGHPYTLIAEKQDISDRNILTKHIRLYGDEVAAVVAETELAAEIAVSLIKAEYEEYPFYLTTDEALCENALNIHNWPAKKNIIAESEVNTGDIEKGFEKSEFVFEDKYATQIVQHCHMENQTATAYMDGDGRWVCISSTQIPHIARRILGQAFNMPLSKFRVIKPFIGGGFGNKQDVTIEPLVVALSMAIGGRAVNLSLEREESIAYTRVRHAITYKMKAGVTKDGKITALDVDAVSTNGGYASHGHSIAAKGAGILASLYNIGNLRYHSKTVYTNTAAAGAMRGYGVPQVIFAIEAMVEKISKGIGMDSTEFRHINFLKEGLDHPLTKIPMGVNKVSECLLNGIKAFNYKEKINTAQNFNKEGKVRGVGVAAFSYATGVYPFSLEIGGCRLSLNQDGTVKILVGATEIGQGSDTVFAQMVAEILSIPHDKIYTDWQTDTDIAPFDTGAYASRQTYVTGMAVEKAALELKTRILKAAAEIHKLPENALDLENGFIIKAETGERLESLDKLALKTYYDLNIAGCLTAEVSNNCKTNSYPMGVSFAEVEVDTSTGEVEILSMLNIHDSGVIINPLLASGQVDGGMGMGIGYALSEELKYDKKTGKPLNNNLLDYKMPTSMDIPELSCLFEEDKDPYGPFGVKGLGEPPLCSPGAAIHNAVCNAIGVEINKMPLNPQTVFEAIERGLVNV